MGNSENKKSLHKTIEERMLEPKAKSLLSFKCIVLSLINMENSQFFLLKILLGEGGMSEEFIIKKDHKKLKRQEARNLLLADEDNASKILTNCLIKVEKFKGTVFKNKLHCEILDFKILEKNKSVIKPLQNEKKLNFLQVKFLDSIAKLENDKYLFSIYLHCLKGGNQFKDSTGRIIRLNIKLESNKKYFFCNLLWDPKTKDIIYVSGISFYEEINSKLTIYNEVYKYNKDAGNVIQGKVIKAKFSNNTISVKTIKDEIVNIQLNGNLIRKISFNSVCNFINFEKRGKSNANFKYNNFSHIIIEEKTIIRFKFRDYQTINKYDTIKINDQYFPIDNKELDIEIKDVPDNNYFRQEISYLKDKKKIHDFIVEVYKERINNVHSYLNLKKDGYCYDFLGISRNEDQLFKNQKIIINNKEETLSDIEKFDNLLKGRICIINIEEQDLDNNNAIKLNLTNKIKSKINNSFKILCLTDLDGNISIDRFSLKTNELKKYPFKMDENYEKELNDFYNKYSNNEMEFEKNREEIIKKYNRIFAEEESSFNINQDYLINNNNIIINSSQNDQSFSSDEDLLNNNENEITDKKRHKINKNIINKENNYRKYTELGFSQFTFENSEIQFEQIKKLCFLQIMKYFNYGVSEHDRDIFQTFIKNYNSLIKSSENMEYIDKIKILLSFVNNRIFDKYNKNYKEATYLVELKEDDNNEIDTNGYYIYIKKAYKILYEILDHLDESSAFFIALHQFNSYIDFSYSSHENMYTGSLLTLNDVKLDFVKNINQFCFLNETKNVDCYAHYCPYTKTIYYNPFTFLQNEIYLHELQFTNEASATVVSLFLIFHEICGHLKTGINNDKDTPKKNYSEDLKIMTNSGILNDSGFIFEKLLSGSTINPIDIMNYSDKKEIESLLNYKIYINKDFEDLRKKMTQIQTKGKNSIAFGGKKPKIKGGNSNNDNEYDYSKMNIAQLFGMFSQKPDNMTDAEYNEYLKNNEGYRKLLNIYYQTRFKP